MNLTIMSCTEHVLTFTVALRVVTGSAQVRYAKLRVQPVKDLGSELAAEVSEYS